MIRSTIDQMKRNGIAVLLIILGFAALAGVAVGQGRGASGDDTVLRAMTAGLEALEQGDHPTAAAALDLAVAQIGTVWGDTPEARQARSIWYEEKVKPFKGDPYERAMAFYYRGILYLQESDFGNAQAAFRNAILQDAFAEEEQHRADLMLPLFLQGWALQAQGSLGPASSAYRQVKAHRPDFGLPDIDAQPNVLIVAETGFAPRKVVDGVGSYKLRYFRGKDFSEVRARVRVRNDEHVLYPMEDIYWQAASRGGRKIDATIEGKARFASRTDAAGTVLTAVSDEFAAHALLTGNETDAAVGDVLGLAGIAALALSSRARPAADARYWDNLPDAVHIGMFQVPPGTHPVSIQFLNADGTELPALEQTHHFTITDTAQPQILWVSSRGRQSAYLEKAGE